MVTNIPMRGGVGKSRFEKENTKYKFLTQTKSTFTITSDTKATITFSKSTSSKDPKIDFPHICGVKTIIPPLNHKVKTREVTKYDKYYSPQQTSPIYHSPKLHFQQDRCVTHPKQ